jgi:phenylacetate-CoA ligase
MRDLGRLLPHRTSSLGSNFRRIDHFLGRSDDMAKVRGVNVYPMACLNAVRSDLRTTGEWICLVDRHTEAGAIRDELTVQVELRRSASAVEDLAAKLAQRLKNDLGLSVRVELVAEGAFTEIANIGKEGKARRLVDRRYAK